MFLLIFLMILIGSLAGICIGFVISYKAVAKTGSLKEFAARTFCSPKKRKAESRSSILDDLEDIENTFDGDDENYYFIGERDSENS